jgi:hypothetical protein
MIERVWRIAHPPLPAAVVCPSFAWHATKMVFPHFVGDSLLPAGRSHVVVGVTWAVRRHGIEIE